MIDDHFRPCHGFQTTRRSWWAIRVTTIVTGRLRLLGCLMSLTLSICSFAYAEGSPVPRTARCSLTSFVPPALFHAKDPRNFGAKCDGVTDDSAAFQKAMNAGDVKVAAGTCVINKTVTVSVSQRHLECAVGTVLKRTVSNANNMFRYQLSYGSLTGDSIVNCHFEGANSPDPVVDWDAPGHWDIPVQTAGDVSHFLLAGNTFSQFFGQSMFQTVGENGGTGDRIIFNTFRSCPLYGPALVGHRNGYVGYNKLIGCTAGVENDHAADNTGGNIFECNLVTSNSAPGYITGGVQGVNTNYSGNIVRYNIITGDKTGILKKHQEGGRDAQYFDNTCINGCTVN